MTAAGLRRVLVTLCITQITSWGVLYYAFPVLAGQISRSTGWSPPLLTGAFSAALVTSAVLGIFVGKWLDRHGPHRLMTVGSGLATAAVVVIALSPNLVIFVAGWLLAGIAMSAVLYPPAFAALTRWYGERRLGALTVLTLAGGLASTIFAPITAVLVDHLDWRTTYLVLAAILAAVTIPAHLVGLRQPWPPAPATGRHRQRPRQIVASTPFIALTVAMALSACASYAVVVNLVPLLTERGIGVGVAAVALGLGGAGQVLGRLAYGPVFARLGVRTKTVVVLFGVAVTTALLAFLTGLAALIIGAMLAGVVRGIMTLVQATAITERWGATHYGQLTGVMSAPVTLTAALAPWIGAVLAAQVGGYGAMFWVLAGIALVAAAFGLRSVPRSAGSKT